MPRLHMSFQVVMLQPQMLMGRRGGGGTRLLGAANNIASVFASFKIRST